MPLRSNQGEGSRIAGVNIRYSSFYVTLTCSECGHQSVHIFRDKIVCIARKCGWEANRYEGPRPCPSPGPVLLGPPVPEVQVSRRRPRQRPRKGSRAKKASPGVEGKTEA